ncbi:MAG: hypothetical protein V1788_00810 [Nanoarchaeota archaeon]
MKTILRFLSVLAVMFFIACSEDIYLHDGEDGKDGKDGYSTLMFFDPIAQVKVYYLDRDTSLSFTSKDLQLYTEAKEGVKIVPDGECYKIFQTIGTAETLVATLCNGQDGQDGADGQDGEDGFSFVIKTTPYLDQNGNPIGQTLSFYLDKDKEGEEGYGVLSLGDEYRSSIIVLNGQNGSPASAFPCFTKSYNVQGANANYFTSTGFVLNGFVYSESDGALYLHESCGSVLFPSVVENKGLLLHTFNYGSKNSWDIVVKVVYRDDTEEVIKNVHLEGNLNFQKNVYSTYSLFEYRAADFNNLQFKNVKRIKIEATASGKCIPEDLFIDNVDEVFGL